MLAFIEFSCIVLTIGFLLLIITVLKTIVNPGKDVINEIYGSLILFVIGLILAVPHFIGKLN